MLVVIGLIIFVFMSGERGDSMPADARQVDKTVTGSIDRKLQVPPGMRARQYIGQLREGGRPYPLNDIHEKAQKYLREGSLADAHLLYFFAAREDYVPAIMMMGEMSDPVLFRAENSLLDHADVIQAYKWYQKAADMDHQAATQRIDGLRQWADNEAETGNPHARQLLLNFQ